MGNAKKIIGSIIEGAGEFIKDSAGQVAETVDPGKLLEQAIGTPKSGTENEFTKYLKDLGGNLSQEQLELKQKEFEEKKKKEMEEAQKVLRSAIPAHMRPTGGNEPTVFEEQKREEEMKKAQAVEAQKKQPKTITAPGGKTTGTKKKRPQSSAFESSKNTKTG